MRKTVKKTKKRIIEDYSIIESMSPSPFYVEPLKPKTKAQDAYIKAINSFDIIFSTGPAGTGKTYIVAALAAERFQYDPHFRLVLTRPAIEAEEKLGYLPGELKEKYEPYIAPVIDILNDRLGKSYVNNLLKLHRIDPQPFAYMRGKTFNNSWIILDEAQNATIGQTKLLLTRIGHNSKIIIDGDTDQIDIKKEFSGLLDAVRRFQNIPEIKFIKFTENDIVRHDIIQKILTAYRE